MTLQSFQRVQHRFEGYTLLVRPPTISVATGTCLLLFRLRKGPIATAPFDSLQLSRMADNGDKEQRVMIKASRPTTPLLDRQHA